MASNTAHEMGGSRHRQIDRIRRAFQPATWSVAWWTLGTLRATKSEHGSPVKNRSMLPEPPYAAQRSHGGIVVRLLRLTRATCLERSLVLQRWYLHFDVEFDVVIGVASEDAFKAHAWLDGTEPDSAERFSEITRLTPAALSEAAP